MRWKKYKPGDRVFYKCYDGSIKSSIVLGVEDEECLSEKGNRVKYQWLKTDEYSGIENFNCLPDNSPELKEIKKKYAYYDKMRASMVSSIESILYPLSNELKVELLTEIQLRLNDGMVSRT